MDKISLIVLNYKDYDTTSKFIDHIKGFEKIQNIVVVDNRSQDGSYEKLLKYSNEKIHVIESDKNGGYSYGNNYGIKYAIENFNCDYIIVSNPDIVFEKDIIDRMIKFYNDNKEEKIGIVTGKMIDKENTPTAWKLPTINNDIMLSSSIVTKIFGNPCNYKKNELDGIINEVDAITGAFFMIPSKLIEKVNFLDEDVFLYCEEIILAKKIKKLGYKNIVLGDITFIHDHSVSINKSISSKVKQHKILFDSKLIYHTKYNQVSKLELNMLKLSFKLGLIEKSIIYNLKKYIQR